MDICLRVQDIPNPGETVLSKSVMKNPGGKGANQAVACAKAGGSVVMLGCVGDDEDGAALLDALHIAGVNTEHVMRKAACLSSAAYIGVADSGENTIIVDSSANMYVLPEYLKEKERLFEAADICVLQMEIPMDSVLTAMEMCRKHHVKIVFNPSPIHNDVKKLLKGVDYLIPNEIEAVALLDKPYAKSTDADWAAFMRKYGIENLLVTLGKQGCCYYHSQGKTQLFPAGKREVADTTGAGDTFLGAFVAALEETGDVSRAICFANTAAGIAVTHSGAQQAMPVKKEVLEELQKGLCHE